MDFFKERLEGLDSIPSHDTFNRFFSLFDTKSFEVIFRNWVREVIGEVKGVVAIDGKLMRGSSKCDAGKVMERMFNGKFAGLKSIVAIKSRRTALSTGHTSEETRYYVSSLGQR